MVEKTTLEVYLLSDSTGETVHSLSRAVLAQFDTLDPQIHVWTLVNEKRQIDMVIRSIKNSKQSLIMYTLVDEALIEYIDKQCKKHEIPSISILMPILKQVECLFKLSMNPKPGQQHHLNKEYFDRIAAMEFTLAHDDGLGLHNIHDADVILVGVSRTSKTPTSVYLAHRGIKTANIPFVQGIPLPIELETLPSSVMVVGLTKDPRVLSDIRKTRLSMINSQQQNSHYDNIRSVKDEVKACREYCHSHGWEVIDVSKRSIEETAATIYKDLKIFRYKAE